MIDNLETIKKLLNFENENEFYMLYIFKRKKDQPEEVQNEHQSVRTIKAYSVSSIEYLEKRYDEIKMLCEVFKARAYIHIQKQNHQDVSLDMITTIAQRVKSGQYKQNYIFDSVVGKIKTYEKRWIVDIDVKDREFIDALKRVINYDLRPVENQNKVIVEIPTRSGVHLITERFDVIDFKKHFPEVDIQKKNPTLLYYPDSLNK